MLRSERGIASAVSVYVWHLGSLGCRMSLPHKVGIFGGCHPRGSCSSGSLCPFERCKAYRVACNGR